MTTRDWHTVSQDRRDPPVPGDSLAAIGKAPGGTVPQSVPRAELAPPPLASNAARHLSRILLAGDELAEFLRDARLAFDAIDEWQAAVRELSQPEPLASRKAPE